MSTKPKSNLPTRPTRLGETKPAPTEVISNPVKTPVNTETVIASTPVVQEATLPIPTIIKNTSYDYKVIVTRNNLDMFQLTVIEHLNSGWELSGGVSCTMYADSYSAATIWSQAIYKKISN
jgi:hypothetical protein